MPKLWVANAEEAFPEDDKYFRHNFATKTTRVFPRFLSCLSPGDCLVVPVELPSDYVEYMGRVLQLGDRRDYLLRVNLASSCFLVDSILEDSEALATLQRRFAGREWCLEPYLNSARVVELGKRLGVQVTGTLAHLVNEGLIEDLNDKAYFKLLAQQCGVRCVAGLTVSNATDLASAIRKLGRHSPEIMLRKVKYAGGAGNTHGNVDELLARIPQWYQSGTVLVEPFLSIDSVAGSLVRIDGDGGLAFLGIDRQVFAHGGWCGFDYPFHVNVVASGAGAVRWGLQPRGTYSFWSDTDYGRQLELGQERDVAEELRTRAGGEAIREKALALARLIASTGAQGQVNIDWAFEKGSCEPIALECNFRHNGLGYVIAFAQRYFAQDWVNMSMRCREAVPTRWKTTGELLEAMRGVKIDGQPVLIDRPGARCGAVVTCPPQEGTFALVVFAKSGEYIDRVIDQLEPVL